MEKSQKQGTQSTEIDATQQDEFWITFADNGKIRSAPLSVFKKIAKERGWKPKPIDWDANS